MSVGLMLQCVVNILISTLFVTQVQSATFTAEDWSLDLSATMKWKSHTGWNSGTSAGNAGYIIGDANPFTGWWLQERTTADSSDKNIGGFTRNLDQDYFCGRATPAFTGTVCDECMKFETQSTTFNLDFELAASKQIRTIYYSQMQNTAGIAQQQDSLVTTVSVSNDYSSWANCENWSIQTAANTELQESGFFKCNQYGKYIRLTKAGNSGSTDVQFCDLKVFSEHTSIFFDFVETITASTGLANYTKDKAQVSYPLQLAKNADVTNHFYESDTSTPPSFYYYDMVLYYPMSVTGIYIFGNSAAAQSNTSLTQTQAITVYYGSSSFPQSNPTVTGNLNQVMAFAAAGETTVVSSIRVRSTSALSLGGVTLMIPGQCQSPTDDFDFANDVYVGVSYIENLALLIGGANPDSACSVDDITLLENRVWHDATGSGSDGQDLGGTINKLPDSMFLVHNNPTDPNTTNLPKRFEVHVTESQYGSASPGTPYVVSVQYTKNGNAGEIFTLFMKFNVINDCNMVPYQPLAETSVKIVQGEVYAFNPVGAKILDGRGGKYKDNSNADCLDAIHVTISPSTDWTQQSDQGNDSTLITAFDYTAGTTASDLAETVYTITRCSVASCTAGADRMIDNSGRLTITVGCKPNNVVIDILDAANAATDVLAIDSFPNTCMEFVTTSNTDGYTYNCDICTAIPWLDYVAPADPSTAESFTVNSLISTRNVGEVWVITRTYSKGLTNSGTGNPADSFSDTITIRVFEGATNYCPESARFKEDAYKAYYGTTKVLKYDSPNWTLTIENTWEQSIIDASLNAANKCGANPAIAIETSDPSINSLDYSAIGTATVTISSNVITWASSLTQAESYNWGMQSFDILRTGVDLAPLSANERYTFNIILECDVTRMWPWLDYDNDNVNEYANKCCSNEPSNACSADGDCTTGTGPGTCGSKNCAGSLQISETYQINVDANKKITLPTYELEPACNKKYYYDFNFSNGTQVPWIGYNSTTGDYEIFSDDVSQTGTHFISVNTGVKLYAQNTYSPTTTTAIANGYCNTPGVSIRGGYTNPSVDDCADRCEDTLGCTYFTRYSSTDCYFRSDRQFEDCGEYANGKPTGYTHTDSNYIYYGLDYPHNTITYLQDEYGNFTWFNSTSSTEEQWYYKIEMNSDPCSAVSLLGITLDNMNITTGDILPQNQVIPDLAVNVTCTEVGSSGLCCGPRVYTIIDPLDEYSDFFTFSDSTDENVLTLQSRSYDDVGLYDIQVNVTLAEWPNAEPVTLTLTVEVEDCVPELEQSGTLNDYTWNAEQNVGPGVPEGYQWPDLVINTPIWSMEPLCDLDLVYSAEGLVDFMTYDSNAHTLTVTNTQARNGTYAITVQAYIESQDILGIDTFDLEIITGETYIEAEPEPEDPRPVAPTMVINEEGEEVDIKEILTVSAETIDLDLNGLRDYVSKQRELGNFQFREFSDSEEEEARVVKVEVGDVGQLGVGFPSKVLVFGDGFLPGPESLDIDFALPVATDDQEQLPERRRLQASPIQGEDYENKILWECTEFTEDGMKFQMSFLNPYEVSTNPETPENVVVKLRDNVFFNAVTLEPVQGEFQIPLPKQYGNGTQKIIVEALGTSFQSLMAAAWALGFILQFWQSTFLYRFWPLYLTVQILVSLVILDVSLPTNVSQILFYLKDVIELNFYPRQRMLEIYENAPASYRAHEAGGALVSWFIPLCAFLLLIVGLMKIVFKHTDIQCYWCIDRTFEFLFYSLPLRIMLLTFLTFCIVASMGEIWCMIYCPLIAFFTFNFFIFQEPQELNIENTQLKFSTLYQEIKTERTGAVLYTPFFMMTRIIFVFFMSLSIFMLQFFGAIFITMFTLLHLIITRPHTDGRMTNLEIFNNIVLMLCFYLMVAFCPYVNDSQDQYNLGWVFIALLYLLFFINIGQVIFSVFEILQNKSRLLTMWARAQNRRANENFGDDVSLISKGSKKGKKKSRKEQDKATGRQSSSRDSIQFLNAALEEDRKRSGVRNSASRRSNELRPGQSFDFARDQSNENFMV